MATLADLLVLAQHTSRVLIPEGGTKHDAVQGLLLAVVFTGILAAGCVMAVRKEQWPLVALFGLLILGTQAVLLLSLTQLLAVPPV
jgi:hypothetical protein